MNQLGHIHDYQTAGLTHADDGVWRERQICSDCQWAVRVLKLKPTPEDEPPAAHKAPCWCPQCMRGKRR